MTEHCITCRIPLEHIDRHPDGRMPATCKRCEAEESHDFDAEPRAKFNRLGERQDSEGYYNRNALKDGHHDALNGFVGRNTYNEGSASWRAYEKAYQETQNDMKR